MPRINIPNRTYTLRLVFFHYCFKNNKNLYLDKINLKLREVSMLKKLNKKTN